VDVVFYIEIGGGGGPKGGTAHVGSFGEREHALSFARLIRNAGYRPRFVVGPLIADHIRLAGFQPEIFGTPGEGVEIVNGIDPVMIIGCELYNLSPASARGLIDSGRIIGTIDGTSMAVPINTDPFDMPQYRRSLVLPDDYYSFRPCPVNDIGPNTSRIFHWSLFPDATRVSKDAGRYQAIGLDPARTTIMFPVAPWAIGSSHIFGLDAGYYQNLVTRIVDGCEAVATPIDLVFISLYRPPSLTVERQGAVTVHYPGLMPYDSYDHLLRSCDAIVSDNIISTSVSKAVVMGTPHLIIQNMGSSEMPYRYNMFPLKVLFPVDRAYARSVDVVEYGDIRGIRAALGAVLANGFCNEGARMRRQEYVDRLSRLAGPGRILEQILGRSEEAGTPVC